MESDRKERWKMELDERFGRALADLAPGLEIADEGSFAYGKIDWHSNVLMQLAKKLGPGNDYYYPLVGAVEKLEMYAKGKSYADATDRAG